MTPKKSSPSVGFESLEEMKKRLADADTDFSATAERMDRDYFMWSLQQGEGQGSSAYLTEVLSTSGNRPFKRWKTEIGFISPNPRSFADHVQARLSASDMQVIVRMLEKEGVDRRDDVSKLEKLVEFALQKADERLFDLGFLPLRDEIIWYLTIRGSAAARIMLWEEEGETIFDFLPLDTRDVRLGRGARGLTWIAYRTYKSAEAIEEKYEVNAADKKNNEVIDYWRLNKGKVYNAVWSSGTWLKKPEIMNLKMLPFIYMAVPTVPRVRSPSQTGLSGVSTLHGDSIYAAARDIYNFENELYSMWASHAHLLWRQPTINYRDDEGKELTTTAFLADEVINLPMNHNKLEQSPVREISPTLVNMVGLVASMRQRATLPDIEYGELRNFPLSGTAINELQQARDKVFGPLLRALNTFYTHISYQIERQLIDGGLDVEIKSEMERKYYYAKVKPVDLKEPHKIRVEFTAQTPFTQLENWQMAQMAKQQGLPELFINEYILKLPDPKEISDMTAVEIAEHSPNLLRLQAIRTLAKQGRKEEAMALVMEMRDEWLAQQPAPPEQPPEVAGGGAEAQMMPPPESMGMGAVV